MQKFEGIIYQLYWHGQSWLPQYITLGGEYAQRIFVHQDRYITMHDYTLLIPPRHQQAIYAHLGLWLINDVFGVRLGFGEIVEVAGE